MPLNNAHLHRASGKPNDEFYTRLADIEKEMTYHRDFFAGKIVYCDCDDPERSDFVRYFDREFDSLALRGLYATGFDIETGEGKGYWRLDGSAENGPADGDFRKNSELLAEADIVVTNPPFTLFREHLHNALSAGKDIITVGGLTATARKDVCALIRDGKLALGAGLSKFGTPDGVSSARAQWFGTLPNIPRNEPLELVRFRDPLIHRLYDHYPAIDVPKVTDIPVDVDGEMGVPVSFFMHYRPEQFRIVGMLRDLAGGGAITVDGNEAFSRVVIRHVDSEGETRKLRDRYEAARKREQVKADRLASRPAEEPML